jgi:hypothetical protein
MNMNIKEIQLILDHFEEPYSQEPYQPRPLKEDKFPSITLKKHIEGST